MRNKKPGTANRLDGGLQARFVLEFIRSQMISRQV